MGSSENPDWFFDYPPIDNFFVATGDFKVPANDILWNSQGINCTPTACVENTGNLVDSARVKESSFKKRGRTEASSILGSKACREKMRRDRLNDKFLELGSILEPGNPKTDKATILNDAARMVTGLRGEAQKLKDSNENLKEKIKELKAEKLELRDEKQRLKHEKESIEHQIELLNARPSFMPHIPVIPTAFPTQGQAGGPKMTMPYFGFHGCPMWQLMPPADVDTSQDAESCPPVA